MLRKQVYLTHNISFVRFAFDSEANTSGDGGRIGIELNSQPNSRGWLLTLPKHREVISCQDFFCIELIITVEPQLLRFCLHYPAVYSHMSTNTLLHCYA